MLRKLHIYIPNRPRNLTFIPRPASMGRVLNISNLKTNIESGTFHNSFVPTISTVITYRTSIFCGTFSSWECKESRYFLWWTFFTFDAMNFEHFRRSKTQRAGYFPIGRDISWWSCALNRQKIVSMAETHFRSVNLLQNEIIRSKMGKVENREVRARSSKRFVCLRFRCFLPKPRRS